MNKKQILRRIMQIVIVLIGISLGDISAGRICLPVIRSVTCSSATGAMPTEELVQLDQRRDGSGTIRFSPSISAGCLTAFMAILENPTV